MRIACSLAFLAILALSTAPAVAAITFTDIGPNLAASGVSSDGKVVSLNSAPTAGTASIWTKENGVKPIGAGITAGVATRGADIIVGANVSSNAYRWDGDVLGVGDWTQLPLEGGSAWEAKCVAATAADAWIGGSTNSTGPNTRRACRYKESSSSTTALGLPEGVSSTPDAYLLGASDIGTFAGRYQFRYTGISGSRQAMCGPVDPNPDDSDPSKKLVYLGTLVGSPSTDNEAIAQAISRDGGRCAGWSKYPGGLGGYRQACWWYSGLANGANAIPFLPGDDYGEAQAMDSTGYFIAGYCYDENGSTGDGPKHCWIWDPVSGTRDLAQMLTDAGVNMTGWELTSVRGMSADGSIICGDGILSGTPHAWVITIPKPTVGINNGAFARSIMAYGRHNFTFVTWGVVSALNWTTDSFVVDDGSGNPITVKAPGHEAYPGDYVRAKGQAAGASLSSTAADVEVLRLAVP